MSSTQTPNMNLIVPGVGTEVGPDWANEINGDLSILDQHNHSSGQGIQIGVSGINIDADFPINNHNLTLIKSSRYGALGAALVGASDIGCVYVVNNELFYNDVTGGHHIQLTNNGSVNAGAGSITGLPSGTASASFSAGTFVWQSATSVPATMDQGSTIIRELVANGKGVTLQTVSGLVGDYPLTFPAALPASSSFILCDASGNMSFQISPLPINKGGIGKASLSAYDVICGGTTSTGAVQQVSGEGTSGQVLTSNGSSALPTWQDNIAVTPWVTYSPTLNLVASGPISSIFSRKEGQNFHVQGTFTGGTISNTNGKITLTGNTINSALLSTQGTPRLGKWYVMTNASTTIIANAQQGDIFYDGSDTAAVYLAASSAAYAYTKITNMQSFMGGGNTEILQLDFTVPVT